MYIADLFLEAGGNVLELKVGRAVLLGLELVGPVVVQLGALAVRVNEVGVEPGRIGDDDVAEAHVTLVVGVVGHAAADPHQEHEVDLLEGAQEARGRVARGGHGLARVTHSRQLCTHDPLCSDVAQRVYV